MHLHRCHDLVLFVLFKHIYMVTYQHLNSSRINEEGQGERIQASNGICQSQHFFNSDPPANFVCSNFTFIKCSYLVFQAKYSEFKDLANCSYRGHFCEDVTQFSLKTELRGEMESQTLKPQMFSACSQNCVLLILGRE